MRNVYSDKSNNINFKARFIHIYLIDGIIFSSFGMFLVLTWPLIEFAPVLFRNFFAIFAIIQGLLMLIACYLHRKETYFKAILSKGSIGVLVGLFLLIWPAANKNIGEHVLILFIASWLFVRGFLHFYIPFKYKKKYEFIINRIYYLIGASELAFGIFLFFFLKSHTFSLIWSVAIYFISAGIALTVFSLKYISSFRQNEIN